LGYTTTTKWSVYPEGLKQTDYTTSSSSKTETDISFLLKLKLYAI